MAIGATSACLSLSADAHADPPPVLPVAPPALVAPNAFEPRRYELAGFPIVGGNSDIGVQFGAAATLTRFYDRAFPYEWNLDMLISASVKDNADGFKLVQQSHVLRLDAPDLFGGRARLDTRGSFQRTINVGYYGLGNASTADPSRSAQRYDQFTQEEARVRAIGRIHTGVRGVDAAAAANLRLENPTVNVGSKLAEDLGSTGGARVAYGAGTALLAGIAGGVMIDTRDSEFVTSRGIFYQLGLGGTVGSSDGIAYGEGGAVLAHYARLGGPFIFASRVVASLQFGRVPFYDLQQGGVFEPQYLFGSENGVRGVPQGRYAGRIKMLTNLEIRATPFPRFRVLGQSLRIGTSTFFDAGRVWDKYVVTSADDGRRLGLKFGVGLGVFLQWGEAAIFRVEAAYSPDAVAENPSLPLGIYVSDGLTF